MELNQGFQIRPSNGLWNYEPTKVGFEDERLAWKVATSNMVGLKDVHGLQIALYLPEGSEIRHQIFYSIDTDDMKGDDG